jgi:FAD/FMN-containing dehydrogenase
VLVISDPAAEPAGAELAAALRRVVGGEIRFDSYSRHLFSRDASMYAIEPIGVVFPRDADDVAAVVSTAGEFGVPVLPRGAGTSLAGQTVGREIVMDLSRHMSSIIEIDAEQRRARVQPGVVQEQLNLATARHGLTFGPDTSTSNRATLGGMIGNNSAGSMSVRYGMTIDHVLALDVVLSDASRSVFGPLTGGGCWRAPPRQRSRKPTRRAWPNVTGGQRHRSCGLAAPVAPPADRLAGPRADPAVRVAPVLGHSGRGHRGWCPRPGPGDRRRPLHVRAGGH